MEACAQELSARQQDGAPKACDPSLVGPDEMVSIATGKRTVKYDWLRDSLRQAASAENSKNDQSAGNPSELSDARVRLEQMTQELASPPASVYVPGNVANIRRKLDAILDSGDYPQAKPPSYLERLWNDFVRWLLRSMVRAMPSGSSTLGNLSSGAYGDRDSLRPADLVVYPQAAGTKTRPAAGRRPSPFGPFSAGLAGVAGTGAKLGSRRTLAGGHPSCVLGRNFLPRIPPFVAGGSDSYSA